MNSATGQTITELIGQVQQHLTALDKLGESLDEQNPDYRAYDEKRFNELENMHGSVEALLVALQQHRLCQVCSEPIRPHSWTHEHNDIYCGTGDGASAAPARG